jgi:hypothetical protein
MSSAVRSVASNVTLPNPGAAIAISFNGFPIQFTHDKNGTLDFVFANGFNVDSDLNRTTTMYMRGSNYSAIRTVDKIGPNIISWLEINEGVDVGTVTLYEKPIVIRANLLLSDREPNNDHSMFESTDQISFERASGNASNKYFATFLFKKPMVLKYKKSGITYYRAFTTQFAAQT